MTLWWTPLFPLNVGADSVSLVTSECTNSDLWWTLNHAIGQMYNLHTWEGQCPHVHKWYSDPGWTEMD